MTTGVGASSALVVFEDLQPCPFNSEQKTADGGGAVPVGGLTPEQAAKAWLAAYQGGRDRLAELKRIEAADKGRDHGT